MSNFIKYILILLVLLLASCAKITFKEDELSYWRLGKQKLEGVTFTKERNGDIYLSFDKQEGTAGDLSKALLNLSTKIP